MLLWPSVARLVQQMSDDPCERTAVRYHNNALRLATVCLQNAIDLSGGALPNLPPALAPWPGVIHTFCMEAPSLVREARRPFLEAVPGGVPHADLDEGIARNRRQAKRLADYLGGLHRSRERAGVQSGHAAPTGEMGSKIPRLPQPAIRERVIRSLHAALQVAHRLSVAHQQ